ncbi:hypothetical protein ACEWY4_012020 [Coilia grayii]|uniref:Uncharacterized protein n=1 Tax=Coilia grayii TaxID=363190 RepID=A0ABD1JZA8_9TELE
MPDNSGLPKALIIRHRRLLHVVVACATMDDIGQHMDINHKQICINLENSTHIITHALQQAVDRNQELCMLIRHLEEREAETGRSLTEQLESNRQLKLKIYELQKQLERKESSFTKANQTVAFLKNELRVLHEQLQIHHSENGCFQEVHNWLQNVKKQLSYENSPMLSENQSLAVLSDAQRLLGGSVSAIKVEKEADNRNEGGCDQSDDSTVAEHTVPPAADVCSMMIKKEEEQSNVALLLGSEMGLSPVNPLSQVQLRELSVMLVDCTQTLVEQERNDKSREDSLQPRAGEAEGAWQGTGCPFQKDSTTGGGHITHNQQEEQTLSDVFRRMGDLQASLEDLKTTGLKGGENATIPKFDGTLNGMAGQQPFCTKNKHELSAEVRRLHRSLGSDLQWKVGPNDRFKTAHNEAVTAAIIREMRDSGQSWGSHKMIRKACNRFFEHLKTQKKLTLAGTIGECYRKKLLKSRRDRLFKKRLEVAKEILSPEDYCYLEGADQMLMSDEESDGEDRGVYVVLPPKWRAARLTRIVQCCQEVIDGNRLHGQKPISARRRRTETGLFTCREPPTGRDKMTYVALDGGET